MGLFRRIQRGISLLRTLDRIAVALERLADRHAPEGIEIIFEPDIVGTDEQALWEKEASRAEYEHRTGKHLGEDEEVPPYGGLFGKGH